MTDENPKMYLEGCVFKITPDRMFYEGGILSMLHRKLKRRLEGVSEQQVAAELLLNWKENNSDQ